MSFLCIFRDNEREKGMRYYNKSVLNGCFWTINDAIGDELFRGLPGLVPNQRHKFKSVEHVLFKIVFAEAQYGYH